MNAPHCVGCGKLMVRTPDIGVDEFRCECGAYLLRGDDGELDLGVVRALEPHAVNNLEVFFEEFSTVAETGISFTLGLPPT